MKEKKRADRKEESESKRVMQHQQESNDNNNARNSKQYNVMTESKWNKAIEVTELKQSNRQK